MKYLLLLSIFTLFALTTSAQRGQITSDTVYVSGTGDSLYIVSQIAYESGDQVTTRRFLGDTSAVEAFLFSTIQEGGPNNLPSLAVVAAGAQAYLQFPYAVRLLQSYRNLLTAVTGRDFLYYASVNYAPSVIGRYRITGSGVATPFNIEVYQLDAGPNVGFLRARRVDNQANVPFQCYRPNWLRVTIGASFRELFFVGELQGKKVYEDITRAYRLVQIQ